MSVPGEHLRDFNSGGMSADVTTAEALHVKALRVEQTEARKKGSPGV